MQANDHKKYLIVGLGESGLAMATWLTQKGYFVKVVDTRKMPPQLTALNALDTQNLLEFVGGDLSIDVLSNVDVVVLSPGLSPYEDPLKTLVDQALNQEIPVLGELDLFIQAVDELQISHAYQPKILAITGTNGKTTTTMLTRHLVAACNLRVAVAGNVSPSLLDALRLHLIDGTLPDVWVLELSSFQLDVVKSWRCDASVVLNITEDHLDWHADMSAYAAAKSVIYKNAQTVIINRDDARVVGMSDKNLPALSFGLNAPSGDNQFGLVTQDGLTWLAQSVLLGHEKSGRNKSVAIHETKLLMPVEALQIKGLHNATNALAALALCCAINLPLAPLLHALRTYKGEPHRMELVATVNEIDFVDDSKGTNVGATVAALSGSLQPIVLIAGGDGKGQDFSPLLPAAIGKVRAICLIGKDAKALEVLFKQSSIDVYQCESLPLATQQAFKLAKSGDVVLLSPACASLDMFKNYKHRAEVFIDAVREIAMDAGQPC